MLGPTVSAWVQTSAAAETLREKQSHDAVQHQ